MLSIKEYQCAIVD
uniref:Uncharacterized protein n=1 Tax=Arundo donax TaxID=35708 RepID=A0A0A9C117_ARUDO